MIKKLLLPALLFVGVAFSNLVLADTVCEQASNRFMLISPDDNNYTSLKSKVIDCGSLYSGHLSKADECLRNSNYQCEFENLNKAVEFYKEPEVVERLSRIYILMLDYYFETGDYVSLIIEAKELYRLNPNSYISNVYLGLGLAINNQDPMKYYSIAREYATDEVDIKYVDGLIKNWEDYINSKINTFQDAIIWMYNNGLTSFKTIQTFNGDGELTREQAAKIFTQFVTNVYSNNNNIEQITKFKDLSKADKTLQPYILKSNAIGLFNGVDGYFYPFNRLTRAQAIAVAVRSIYGYQDESGNKWYDQYYSIVNNLNIINSLGFDYYTLDKTYITRKEIALLLYYLRPNQ